MKLAVVVLSLVIGSAVAAPKTTPPSVTMPGAKLVLEEGVVRFVDRLDLPRTVVTYRGRLDVVLGVDYVVVRHFNSGHTHVFPKQNLVYAGTDDVFDQKQGE